MRRQDTGQLFFSFFFVWCNGNNYKYIKPEVLLRGKPGSVNFSRIPKIMNLLEFSSSPQRHDIGECDAVAIHLLPGSSNDLWVLSLTHIRFMIFNKKTFHSHNLHYHYLGIVLARQLPTWGKCCHHPITDSEPMLLRVIHTI